ncbi:Hcp family type VI secretion system effector [Sphingomicrobium arenosum]|uniref:hypothetical protein n=1 Tax=Sphingomicrobium arenosum TaxID=2233861 RepID=UPI002240F1FD|nr:hypothetical protein [Sphingomicrobium arenosum]
MTNIIQNSAIKTIAAAMLASVAGFACQPAHAASMSAAGPFDFLKKAAGEIVEKKARDVAEQKGLGAVADAALGEADGGSAAAGTTPHEEEIDMGQIGWGALAGLVQNGTTVETADEVLAPEAATGSPQTASADVNGDGIPDIIVKSAEGHVRVIDGATGALLQAGHTTVETADEVQAPQTPQAGDEHEVWYDIAALQAANKDSSGRASVAVENGKKPVNEDDEAALLLPAVQAKRAASRPTEGDADYTTHAQESGDRSGRAKVSIANGKKPVGEDEEMSQNGHTTVETADEVQAPGTGPQPALTGYLKIDDIPGESSARGKTSQNGTTIETAAEVDSGAARPTRRKVDVASPDLMR